MTLHINNPELTISYCFTLNDEGQLNVYTNRKPLVAAELTAISVNTDTNHTILNASLLLVHVNKRHYRVCLFKLLVRVDKE